MAAEKKAKTDATYLFPAQVLPILNIVAQLGIILYMFTIGLEFDVTHVRRHGLAFVAISQAGIIAPMASTVVIMALTTTMATAPALDLLAPCFRKSGGPTTHRVTRPRGSTTP